MTTTTLEVPVRFDGVQYRGASIEKIDPDDGTMRLRAVPYGVECRLEQRLWESFEPGAFKSAVDAPHRVKLYYGHSPNGGVPIGHARVVEDRPDGLWILAKRAATLAAQEAWALASDGDEGGGATLDQCSIEFRPKSEWMTVSRRADGLHVRHARGHLLGVALVPHGAYSEDAFVASVREADADRRREAIVAHLRSLTS
jgi:HK97 family phage prohead protease